MRYAVCILKFILFLYFRLLPFYFDIRFLLLFDITKVFFFIYIFDVRRYAVQFVV